MSSFEPERSAADTERTERERSLLDLVRLDYDATLRAMSGFISTGGQIRAIGIAVWGVVLGLAVGHESSVLAALGAILVVVFAYGDAYHASLYRRTLTRAMKLEALLDGWIDRLGIDADDPDATGRARARLEMHRFGVHRALRKPGWKDLVAARPRPVFWGIYPGLLFASIVVAVVYALN